jgi:hypothetical protein
MRALKELKQPGKPMRAEWFANEGAEDYGIPKPDFSGLYWWEGDFATGIGPFGPPAPSDLVLMRHRHVAAQLAAKFQPS